MEVKAQTFLENEIFLSWESEASIVDAVWEQGLLRLSMH